MKSKKKASKRRTASRANHATLTDRAYSELEEIIVTLQIPPGTVLSERTLMQRLKIGRTPTREALQRLAHDGLVVIIPRRGIMVSEINLQKQFRLLEVRREIERLMARLAAERANDEERKEFAELAKNMLGRTFCPLGDAAALPTISIVEKFYSEFEAKVNQQIATGPFPILESVGGSRAASH